MSQENFEIVRQAVHAFNERDVEALVAMLDPAAEIELVGGLPMRWQRGSGTGGGPELLHGLVCDVQDNPRRGQWFLEASGQVLILTKLDATVEGSGTVPGFRFAWKGRRSAFTRKRKSRPRFRPG